MTKVDTDQGLGPGSEDRRREVRKAQDELDSQSKLKTADTQPGIGKVDRKSDTVDDLLDGFGPSRPDIGRRILPKEDTTPPPEPVRRELTPTEPGKRQRVRNMILASVATFGIIVAAGVAMVKMSSSGSSRAAMPPTATVAPTQTAEPPPTVTVTAPPTPTGITTMSVESLPTAAKTAAPVPHVHASSAHATATASPPTATATTTAAPHPTGSAPPGMNLLPDDPHR